MAQKILEKLDILDEQEKILLTKREKVNRLHYGGRKKSLNTPLTCDFQSESEPPITKPALKTASMIEEDKSYTNKLKRSVSFKCDPEDKNDSFEKLNVKPHFVPANENKQENKSIEKLQMIEENPKSKSSRPLLYLKDTPEVESFLNEFYSYNDSAHRRSFGSSAFSPVLSIQSNVYKKEKDSALFTTQTTNKPTMAFDPVGTLEDYLNKSKKSPPQIHDCTIPEGQCTSNGQLIGDCSVRKENLLPLCFEDELRKPNAKIINVNAPKTEISHMLQEQNDTTPIVFHDTRYVQMILLTKNKIPLPHRNKQSIYPSRRADFVSERHCGAYASLIGGQSITPSSVKATAPAAWREKKQAPPTEVTCRWVEDKRKRKTNKQILENKYWNKRCNVSETFASLTKTAESFLDKTSGQERSAKTGKLERMFSTMKPMSSHKFCASAVKLSKPLRNKLEIHKVSNVTPLDDLLVMTSKA